MDRFKITKEGYEKIRDELNQLVNVERPAIAVAINNARELGDLTENEEYATAKDKQRMIETMIDTLSTRLSNAEVVEIASLDSDKKHSVDFGAKVKLLDINTNKEINYCLLSEYEADLTKGIIALDSVVGRAIFGKKVGDDVEIKTPAGLKEYEIVEIKY